jgi:Cu-Zn family superoxide dismutase
LANVPLVGEYGINGLGVVVHAMKDDLGLGGNDGSRAVGNAGSRPGCGTIVAKYD